MPNVRWSQEPSVSQGSLISVSIEINAIITWTEIELQRLLERIGQDGRCRGGGRADAGGIVLKTWKIWELEVFEIEKGEKRRRLTSHPGFGTAERAVLQQWEESTGAQCLLKVTSLGVNLFVTEIFLGLTLWRHACKGAAWKTLCTYTTTRLVMFLSLWSSLWELETLCLMSRLKLRESLWQIRRVVEGKRIHW